MDTQATQSGLMPLLSNQSNASTNLLNPLSLETASTGASIAPSFNHVLAQYQTKSPVPLISNLPSSAVEALPLLGKSLPLEDAGLPLEDAGLPLANLLKPTLANMPEVKVPVQDKLLIAEGALTREEDELTGHLLNLDDPTKIAADQGYHAQSLVSSLLPTQINTLVTQSSHGSTATGLTGAKLEAELGGELGSEFEAELDTGLATTRVFKDRFLGAQGASNNSLLAPSVKAPNPSSSNTMSSSPMSTPVLDATLLAINNHEDPISESLQELKQLDDIEQEGNKTHLALGERKQDEQSLKLTKGQQAWGDALAERISMNAAKNIKQVTIHLDPPELGSLELKLQVKDDQQTQVQVQVQNLQVKEALESSAQRLKDMLANQGLELAEFDVQTGAEQGQGQMEEQQQEQGSLGQQDSDALSAEEELLSLDISVPKNNNLLDTFV